MRILLFFFNFLSIFYFLFFHQFSILINWNFAFFFHFSVIFNVIRWEIGIFLYFLKSSILYKGKFAFCHFPMLFNGNLRIEKLREDVRTNIQTEGGKEIHPGVLRDIGPLGPLPKKAYSNES